MTLVIKKPTGGKLVMAKGQSFAVDPLFGNVSLLLHGNGANGSTTIIDNSPTPKTVTAFGDAKISTAQSKFGGASIAFDGNGDYLDLNAISITSDFTLEAWVYLPSLTTDGVLASSLSDNMQLLRFGQDNVSGAISVYVGSQGSYAFEKVPSGMSASTWHHVALTRSANTSRIFVDGAQKASATNWTQPFNIASIGRLRFVNALFLNAFLDDLRITNVARYTANFTPPTAPFPDF